MLNPRSIHSLIIRCLVVGIGVVVTASSRGGDWLDRWRAANPVWRGAHVLVRQTAGAEQLEASLPLLAKAGLNVLIIEINYGFAFDSHPELRAGDTISKDTAQKLARECRRNGIRLIPQFSCLGHQSWAGRTFPLLTRYSELDETPGQYPDNKDIYCRSWCPQNPRVNEIVFPLLDEILNAFEADAMHVGMDEVFLIGSEHCPRCRGQDPAKLFARSVNDLHAQLVERRGVEMLLWADRLLDSKATGYGEWEAARNGTHPAVDLIPTDIILCDWHYEPLAKYPGKPADYSSIPYLLGKGFRVWPAGWKNTDAVRAFVAAAKAHRTERLLGYLATTWGAVKPDALAGWQPLVVGFEGVADW